MKRSGLLFSTLLVCLMWACGHEAEEQSTAETGDAVSANLSNALVSAALREMTDGEYPDNPDIEIRSELDGTFAHSRIQFERKGEKGNFLITILPENEKSDTILLEDVNLLEWMPTAPAHIRQDSYLTRIGLINQEYNRHQVRFRQPDFSVAGNHEEGQVLSRVDLARNCLMAGLWEVIGYTQEDGKEKPCYHGWFDFPESLYGSLFEERSGLSWDQFKQPLQHWEDLPSKPVNLDLLRTVNAEREVEFVNKNTELYPMLGERKKKAKNVMSPAAYTSIQDLLSDSTVFATFSPPGFYNQKEPKSTQLGRFANLEQVMVREISSPATQAEPLLEVELFFRSKEGVQTRLLVGGITRSRIPALGVDLAHTAWQMPMGIGNHSFYEAYNFQQASPVSNNPFYALLLDEAGNFLDSHIIGIDGPLLHFDKENPSTLHFWILSFERHALTGHFELNMTGV